ncbi:hypothetical protein [Desulfitobacterium hafniense]|uniref:Uncharacterized protein n=1 Tax=Desulfitobacterium hafniense TaxID=49338 RepID=A0A0W1JBU3_DESHA|nr:hypothetical protein [Desulfitobacterium hafniense]KTE89297.1 hypothetical protein AT727_12920 [Desulfitobacterium hafniense]
MAGKITKEELHPLLSQKIDDFAAHEAENATETKASHIEIATQAEVTAGTDAVRAVVPKYLKVELDKKANLASPTLTGTPTAPTAATATNNTQIATTAFVKAQGNLPLTGGTMTGTLVAQNNTNYTTKQVRNITLSTATPSGGGNGDLWFVYE